MSIQESALRLPWYRSLSRDQWKVLVASNLGWTFDGFEIFALFLTVGFALRQLLDVTQYAAIPEYAGYILAATVFGWATGGVIGGIIADYIGRKRTMMLAILAYSLTTGLSAFAWDWESFAVLRFLVGVAIGSEWATGASIVSELWPDHARGKGGGLLQSGAGIGGLLASGVWMLIGSTGPNAWRWMYLVGVLPAFVVLWIRRNIPESPRWEEAHERRRAAQAQKESGAALEGVDAALTRFTVVDLFTDRSVRRPLILSFLMMLSVTFAYWGVGTFIPTYVGGIAAKAGLSAPYYSGLAGFLTSVCGIVGFMASYGLVSLRGVMPLSSSYDHVGPMTRSVRDAALVLQAIAGHDARDITSLFIRSRKRRSESKRERSRSAVLEVLEALLCLTDRWNVFRRDPPEREDRTLNRVEPLLSVAKQPDVRAAVDELLQCFERFPHRHVDGHELVLEWSD